MISNGQEQIIKEGSLVSISVFPRTVLYTPYGLFPVINHYVAYGFDNIEDFFEEHSLYIKDELIKKEDKPFTGLILNTGNYKIVKPHKVYSVHMFYKVFIDMKKKNYWFSKDDVKSIENNL